MPYPVASVSGLFSCEMCINNYIINHIQITFSSLSFLNMSISMLSAWVDCSLKKSVNRKFFPLTFEFRYTILAISLQVLYSLYQFSLFYQGGGALTSTVVLSKLTFKRRNQFLIFLRVNQSSYWSIGVP